ncbi:TPA: glycosyltransferase family 2 protein [Vibrio cholerae]
MKISVCVISFNQEQYIEQCISSLIEQDTYGEFEIEFVICDDSSTDNTWSIIERFSKKDKRIKSFRHTENQGMMKNLSFALSQCSGKYIALCEGDDFWLVKNKLYMQWKALDENKDCGLVITPSYECNNAGVTKNILFYKGAEKKEFDLSDILNHSGQFAPTASYMFSRDVVELLPVWFDSATVGDLFIEVYSSLRGACLYLPVVTCCYRTQSLGSWSYMTRQFNYQKNLTRAENLFNDLKKSQSDFQSRKQLFEKKISESLVAQAESHLMLGNNKNFKRLILISKKKYFPTSRTHSLLYYLKTFPTMAKLLVSLKNKVLLR